MGLANRENERTRVYKNEIHGQDYRHYRFTKLHKVWSYVDSFNAYSSTIVLVYIALSAGKRKKNCLEHFNDDFFFKS